MRASRAIVAAMGLVIGLSLAAAARAEQPGPAVAPYLGLGAGPAWTSDVPPRGGTVSSEVGFHNGWATIGTVGLALDRNWRAEVEIGYRLDDARSLAGASGGEVAAWSGMGNLLFDVNTGSGWTPYVGAGIGTFRTRAPGLRASAGGLNDDNSVLAYQGILGVSYAFTPSSRFFVDYRYLRTADPNVRDSAGTSLHTESGSSSVLMGMRFTLPQPSPDR